jgi:hypothetical protein
MTPFGKAFAAARKAGKKTFTWNGNRYTTKLATETKAKKSVPIPAKRPTTAKSTTAATTMTGRKTRAAAEYPVPMRAVGIARKGSGLSKIVARSENKPVEAKKKPVQGPTPEGVWYARKGSAMSIAAARRANRPVSNGNAATAYALGLMPK